MCPVTRRPQRRPAGGRLVVLALLLTSVLQAQSGPQLTTMSAASFKQQTFAREMIVSSFGDGLATSTENATQTPLPNTLAGTTLKLVDSRNREGYAQLFFVSAKQVNWLIPNWLSDGAVSVTVTSGAGTVSKGTIQIGQVAPGLFTANATGTGVAAAMAVSISGDGRQTTLAVADCGTVSGSCVPVHLDSTAPNNLILLLFGTGIRGYGNITARIGSQQAAVLGAQAQSEYAGLDQVNVQVPPGLSGVGDVDVVLMVDGQSSNPVTVALGPAPYRLQAANPATVIAGSTTSITLTGDNLSFATGLRFYPPEGVTVSNFKGSATNVSAQVTIAASALAGERRVCITSQTGRSNCLPFAVTASSTPVISNLKISTATTQVSGGIDFIDGDGDIVYTGRSEGSAKLIIEHYEDTSFSGTNYRLSCRITGTGSFLDKRGQLSGSINFVVRFSGTVHVTVNYLYTDKVSVKLVDAGGRESNALEQNVSLFACPSN